MVTIEEKINEVQRQLDLLQRLKRMEARLTECETLLSQARHLLTGSTIQCEGWMEAVEDYEMDQ